MYRNLLRDLLPVVEPRRLGNGLTVCVLHRPRAPVVASVLLYRAGSRDDPDGHAGCAHFLEHMMFRGTPALGDGEIDALTRRWGGGANAFTSHDATAYEFELSAERWHGAVPAVLEVEADRMAGLALERRAVARERAVILEELAMYRDDPWDALEQAVYRALFPRHPYGRPVLGEDEDLRRTGARALRAFHRRFYRPANATLVLAGDLAIEPALEAADRAFGPLDGGPPPSATEDGNEDDGGPFAPGPLRLERRQGEVARMLLALPGPAAADPEHPRLRVLLAILAAGRASRLQRALVEGKERCAWVACDLQESRDPGAATVALEVLPGVAPEAVEATVRRELAAFVAKPPSAAALARARRILLADWVRSHEHLRQQAQIVASSVALGDLDLPRRWWREALSADAETLHRSAHRWLDPERAGVTGWSLPANGDGDAP